MDTPPPRPVRCPPRLPRFRPLGLGANVRRPPRNSDAGRGKLPFQAPRSAVAWRAMASGKRWTRDELLIALNVYHKLSFGQLHARNPVIIQVARKLGRRPAASR